MRRALVMLLVFVHVTVAFSVAAEAPRETTARSSQLEVIGLDQVTVHRDELVEVLFTLHNTGDGEDTFTFELGTQAEGLTVTGLPLSKTMESGYLRQVKFNLSADIDAEYGVYNLSMDFTSANDADWNQTQVFQVRVTPYSNLNFGATGVSSFIVSPNTRTSVAMNITNNATLTDDVTFNLYSTSGWEWGWTMNNSVGVNAYETLQPDSVGFVVLWVEVPDVIDGAPLFNTGPRFQITAVSSIDGGISQWSFDMLMNEFNNASIDSTGEDAVIEPGGVERVSIDVRNTGNSPNYLNITLEAIDEQGMPIDGVPNFDRITQGGWTMALFGGLEENILQPNESRTIKIAFQAPLEYSGEIEVRLRVFAEGALEATRTYDVGASIGWERSGSAHLRTDECRSLLPGDSCSAGIEVHNSGNAVDAFAYTVTQIPSFVSVELLLASTELSPGEYVNLTLLSITANASSLAFELGEVIVETHLMGTDTVVGIFRVPVKIAPVIQWNFTDVIEEFDSDGRLSIALTLRNEGNTADGLLVQLQSSHSTPMSFIPPNIAVYEEGIENLRSFEVNNIPIGYNFTLRAWVELPQDQLSNGTVWVNTTVRSQFEPSTLFVHTSNGNYTGTPWQETLEEDSFDALALLSTGVDILKAWSLMIGAVLFSGLVIYKSIVSRNQRLQEQRELEAIHAPLPDQVVGDWMNKFSNSEPEAVVDTTPKIDSEQFKQAFKRRSGEYKEASKPVDTRLTQAATSVLEYHSSNDLRTSADALLSDIQTGNVATQPQEIPQNLNRSAETKTEPSSAPNVPLPKEDDFDI